jgi:hypothetical protein
MVNSIGTVSGIIVIIKIICVVNYGCITMIPIPSVMIIIIMMINSDCHYGKRCKIGRIKSVIIRRNIGHVSR